MYLIRKQAALTCTAVTLLLSCSADPGADGIPEVVREDVDTLITTRRGMLGEPTSLDVGPDGRLYIADRINSAVYRLNPRDTTLTVLAGTGPGPEEVQEPVDIEATGEAILIADGGNGRVQKLGLDGTYRDRWPLPARGTILLDLAPDGRAIADAAGRDPARAALHGIDGERLTDIGEDPFEAPRTVSVARMRSRAARGEVPEVFRLAVLPRFDSEGNVWLALRADRVVQKYGPDGTLILERELDQSEIPEMRSAYVRANAEAESGVTPLNFVADFESVGGEVWVLLNRPDARPLARSWSSSRGVPGRIDGCLRCLRDRRSISGPGAPSRRWPLQLVSGPDGSVRQRRHGVGRSVRRTRRPLSDEVGHRLAG